MHTKGQLISSKLTLLCIGYFFKVLTKKVLTKLKKNIYIRYVISQVQTTSTLILQFIILFAFPHFISSCLYC